MNDDEISRILTALLIILVVVVFILFIILIILRIKSKPKRNKDSSMVNKSKDKTENSSKTTSSSMNYNKESIFNFMKFDKIEDNMIIRNNGTKFLMVMECQGINYDLMSGFEKNGVEQGFIQFLNTLRNPIQIYVQTRTVNLESSILSYKGRVNEIKNKLAKKQMEYSRLKGINASEEEIKEANLDMVRERNLYEYGVDIIQNTERMSLNKNILRKHYYVIISYTPEETNDTHYSKEEIKNMAFSDLYTKSQAIMSALGVCGINSKILDSTEIAELLYVAYNRDESEIYDLKKAMNLVYDEMYSTAQDVFEKRIQVLDERIKQEAKKKANKVLMEATEESENERRAREKEEEMDDLIREMAEMIINENENIVGVDVANRAVEKLKKETTEKEG